MGFAWKEKGVGVRRSGKGSKYDKYFASKTDQLVQLIKGDIEAIDIRDIAEINPEKKNWTGSVSFTKTGFAYGNMAPVVAAAKAIQALLPGDSLARYIVRINPYGELVLGAAEAVPTPTPVVVKPRAKKAAATATA